MQIGPPAGSELPSFHIKRIGPTGRVTYLASRRTNPLEHFWTKYRTNAAFYYPEKAQKILKEAPKLGNPFMEYTLELVNPAPTR